MGGTIVHESPGVIVPGQRVYLGPMRPENAHVFARWLNDLAVSITLSNVRGIPFTVQDEVEWIEQIRRDPHHVVFTVYTREGDQPIGNVGLHDINWPDRNAELGVMIGERTEWGQGYATEAISLLLDYAFTILGLRMVFLRCIAYNERAYRLYERLGFRTVGRLRQSHRIGQRYYDVIYMDILAEEFVSPVLASWLHLPREGSDVP
jgi:RimJ/RimL family protein N-acetyltransferase